MSRLQMAALVVLCIAAAGLLLAGVYNWLSDVFGPKPVEQKYDYKTQLDFLKWSICARTSDIQMYKQNPKSTHPNVQKLVYDINLYNRMANELRKDNASIGNLSITNCP